MILDRYWRQSSGPDGAPPLATARWAAARLDALPGLRLRGLSRWYLTEPVPPSGQPPYVNAIAASGGRAGRRGTRSGRLLAWLQAIEAQAGRVRGERNAARTLDLDIIAMGDAGRWCAPRRIRYCRTRARICGRSSWCRLLDVAPGWVHPVLRRSARDLLRELPEQGISAI